MRLAKSVLLILAQVHPVEVMEQEATPAAAAEAGDEGCNGLTERWKQGVLKGNLFMECFKDTSTKKEPTFARFSCKNGLWKVRRRSMGRRGRAAAHQHKLKHRMLMEVLQLKVV